MRVLETRQTGDEILLMSWSPRMDLLALVNSKGELSVHRLSWQRVWHWKLREAESSSAEASENSSNSTVPSQIAWHPEGLFLALGFEKTVYILDVESGKDLYNHDVPQKIQFVQWSASKYEILKMSEGLPTSNGWSEPESSEIENGERIESNLSILFIGTSAGAVHIYSGGQLLILILSLPPGIDASSVNTLLTGDTSPDLQYFHFLLQTTTSRGLTLSLVQYFNETLPELAPLIAPLAYRQDYLRTYWGRIQTQITTMGEHWEKIVEIYNHYMTFAKSRVCGHAVADWVELALLGFGSVELDFFLGSATGMREKEGKKYLNVLTTAFAGVAECLSKIKKISMQSMMGLVEVEGFLKHITHAQGPAQVEENPMDTDVAEDGVQASIIPSIRESFAQLYFIALQLKKKTQDYAELFRNFMRLVINQARSYHVVETGGVEFIEEDPDPDKLLVFLVDIRMEKNIFDFWLSGTNEDVKSFPAMSRLPPTRGKVSEPSNRSIKFGDTPLFDFQSEDANCVKMPWLSLEHHLAKSKDAQAHAQNEPVVPWMEFSVKALRTLLDNSNLVPTITGKIDSLFQIPLASSTQVCTTEYNLIVNDQSILANVSYNANAFVMYMDSVSKKTYVSAQDGPTRILLFELDTCCSTLSSTSLAISRSIHSCAFFGTPSSSSSTGPTYLTLMSHGHDHDTSNDIEIDTGAEGQGHGQSHGRTILVQVALRGSTKPLPPNTLGMNVPFYQGVPMTHPHSSEYDVKIEVPLEDLDTSLISSPGGSAGSPGGPPPPPVSKVDFVDQYLPIDDFSPVGFAVSGARKVGAVLGVGRRTVVLLEMDPKDGEADDDGTEVDEESFDSTGTKVPGQGSIVASTSASGNNTFSDSDIIDMN